MAKGTTKIEQATAAAKEARARSQQQGLPQLYTSHVQAEKGGNPVVVRFLEQGQDINSYDRHEYHVPNGKGGTYRRLFTCLKEQPWCAPQCPGCDAGLKIKLRGAYNVIQRNRAILRKDKDGRSIKNPADGSYIVDGFKDQVVILEVPSTTAEVLRQKDGDYHGLMGLDLRLGESASSFQPWSIEPADIVNALTPMSENDMALATQKYNLDEFMKPPSFQEAAQIVAQYGNSGGGQNSGGGFQGSSAQGNANQTGPVNGFLNGAQVPAGVPATAPGVPVAPGGAFGAAAAAQAPPVPVPPAANTVNPAPTPEQGQVPVVGDPQGAQQGGQPVPAPAPVPVPTPAPVQQQ